MNVSGNTGRWIRWLWCCLMLCRVAPAKPLTAEQVSLVRAWIDQGAKERVDMGIVRVVAGLLNFSDSMEFRCA